MAKRVDYQDPNGDLAEVHERRNAEIRAWADARIAASNAHLTDDHVTTVDDWDLAPEPTEPQEEEKQDEPVDKPVEEPTPEPEPEEEKPEPEKKPAAKKTAAKKTAAPAKEATSKED